MTVTIFTNNPPVTVADTASAIENGAVVAINVLPNDTDVNLGDSKIVLAVDGTGLQGTAAIAADGSGIVFTPYQSLLAGQTGTDTFTYRIVDSAGQQSTAAVNLTIVGANEPVCVTPPSPLVGALGDVLSGTSGSDVIYSQAGDDEILRSPHGRDFECIGFHPIEQPYRGREANPDACSWLS